tara:strand:+ start:888 stop:1529 length:642 start_codon:yes stop_codon:yes gene_type:complete
MDIDLVNQTVAMMNPGDMSAVIDPFTGVLPQQSVAPDQIAQLLVREAAGKALDNSFAQTWGSLYQTQSDPKKMDSFISNNNVKVKDGVIKGLDSALAAFKGDKGIDDQSRLKELLIRTAKHESLGGKYLEQLSGGPGRGAWQVEPNTAKDVLKNSGLIGKKAEKVLGKTKSEILKMSDEKLSTYLKNHKVNAVFATAKYLQSADAKDQLDLLK